ncbi:MAG: M23 family metallopeptidase [Nocardioides sp.]
MRLPLKRPLTTGVLAAGLVLGVGLEPAAAAPETDYEMPFPCGQEWTGTTRASHSPSTNSIDWNRPDDIDDPVVAAATGKVIVAEPRGTGGYGNWVRVSHLDGESTIYAHLRSVSVAVGQTVDQGTLLGTLGSTGNSTGPHLHFEERNSSGVVAPYFSGVAFRFGSTLASRNCVDVPVAANLLGDQVGELAVFRRATVASFRIHRVGRDPRVIRFGTGTDQPVTGDWDGNGRHNVGVRTPATRTFKLKVGTGVRTLVFGGVRDLPIAGDWDGNGVWEVGVRQAGDGKFRMRANDGTVTAAWLGDADDLPVTGDWDGDGRSDLGAYDLATATFTLRVVDSDGLAWTTQVRFGSPGDLPVAADWDGNGRTDVGVWDPATATFSQRRAPSPTGTQVRSVTDVRFGRPR